MTVTAQIEAPPLPTAPSPKQTIWSVQIMRGLAAIAVALYHSHLILAQPEYGGQDILGWLSSRGWLGVNFFFVLSGFIILFAHAKDIGRPGSIPKYAWRRVTRVYPVYWVFVTAFIIAALKGVGHIDFSLNLANMASVYALVDFVKSPSLPLKVAWTLFYEMRFYAIFAVLLVDKRIGIAVLAAWTIGIFVKSIFFGAAQFDPLHMWNIYFLFGMLSCLALKRVEGRWATAIMGAGALSFVLAMIFLHLEGHVSDIQDNSFNLFVLAIPFALMILGGALYEKGRSWKPPRLFTLLGEASYSIYLVHSPTISIIALLNHKFIFGLVPPIPLFIMTATAAVAAGVAAHIVVERPLLRVLRNVGNRFGHRSPAASPAEAG